MQSSWAATAGSFSIPDLFSHFLAFNNDLFWNNFVVHRHYHDPFVILLCDFVVAEESAITRAEIGGGSIRPLPRVGGLLVCTMISPASIYLFLSEVITLRSSQTSASHCALLGAIGKPSMSRVHQGRSPIFRLETYSARVIEYRTILSMQIQ
jgi:hypothetical protein